MVTVGAASFKCSQLVINSSVYVKNYQGLALALYPFSASKIWSLPLRHTPHEVGVTLWHFLV